jgi:hypothetical protein
MHACMHAVCAVVMRSNPAGRSSPLLILLCSATAVCRAHPWGGVWLLVAFAACTCPSCSVCSHHVTRPSRHRGSSSTPGFQPHRPCSSSSSWPLWPTPTPATPGDDQPGCGRVIIGMLCRCHKIVQRHVAANACYCSAQLLCLWCFSRLRSFCTTVCTACSFRSASMPGM